MNLVIAIFLKLITCFFILLFLIRPELGLYPYSNIGGSLWTHVVDRDALDAKILFSMVCFGCSISCGFISMSSLSEIRSNKGLRLIFIVLAMTSVLEVLFCFYRFLEFQTLSLSLEDCKNFSGKSRGCYMRK